MTITRQELEKHIANIPKGIDNEVRRTICSILTGYHEEKTLSEIIKYYNLDANIANQVSDEYRINVDVKEKQKRGVKKNAIKIYLQNNVGKITSGKELVEELGVTLPTFYNFFNNNRAYFKKVSRGKFEILDPDAERKKEK